MICAERFIALEVILDAPDGTSTGRRSCEISFGDSANLDAR
jgi:hypothetical protein